MPLSRSEHSTAGIGLANHWRHPDGIETDDITQSDDPKGEQPLIAHDLINGRFANRRDTSIRMRVLIIRISS